MVSITVSSVDGRPVEAQAAWNGASIVVSGASWIASGAGNVTVSAPGYRSQVVSVDDQDVEVILVPVYRLDVRVFDAVADHRIAGIKLSLEDPSSQQDVLVGTTNEDGECSFNDVAEGDYLLYGELSGYVPFASSLAAAAPGLALKIDGDLLISVAMSPIYVALCAVNNSTNLEDAVLRALLMCNFSEQPGPNLPQWIDMDMASRIAAAADSLGIVHAYGQSCVLTAAPQSLTGQVNFVLRGKGPVASVEVVFQPFSDFARAPRAIWHSLEGQWDVGRLTVECPIDLRICVRSGIAFGGLKTKAGAFTCQLPHGKYIVGPMDQHPLLDPELWTREVQVPDVSHVSIAPPDGFAMLEIVDGKQWPRGVLCCSGAGFTLGIPLKNLPVTMPVSPRGFDFTVLLSHDLAGPPVWRERVAMQAGERRVLTVGGR